MTRIKRKNLPHDTRLLFHDRCYVCGATEGVRWHHVVPLCYGGQDTVENLIPLCQECHMRSHGKMPHVDNSHITGGRPRKWPKNYKDVIEDFVRCRISKSECTFRLNRNPSSYTYTDVFKDCLKELGIASYRNNIDTTLSHKDAIRPGDVVGRVTYLDGTVEEMIWGKETPLSGASSVPTSDHPKGILRVRKVPDYVNPFI